jgi:hypothetical protein
VHYLSSGEIRMLRFQVNSDSSLATAAGMLHTHEHSGTPEQWSGGQVTPTQSEMERLVVLQEVVGILTKTSSLKDARKWLDTHMISLHSGEDVTVFEAVGRGSFEVVRDAAREHMRRRR